MNHSMILNHNVTQPAYPNFILSQSGGCGVIKITRNCFKHLECAFNGCNLHVLNMQTLQPTVVVSANPIQGSRAGN